MRLQLLLQPRFQLRHACVVPRKITLLHVFGALIAEVCVYGGVEQVIFFIIGKAVAKLADAAGVYKGTLEPAGRQNFKIGVDGDPSFLWGTLYHAHDTGATKKDSHL